MKETARIRGSPTTAAPASAPPCTSWNTPAGTPEAASVAPTTAASRWLPCGAYSLGLRIVGQPAASAFATLCAAIGAGAFHGTTQAAGPQGSRSAYAIRPSSRWNSWLCGPCRSWAAASRNEPPRITPSGVVCRIGTPVVADSSAQISAATPSTASATASSTSARSGAGSAAQLPASCAADAAATAASIRCDGVPAAGRRTAPVAGSSRSNPSGASLGVQTPSTRSARSGRSGWVTRPPPRTGRWTGRWSPNWPPPTGRAPAGTSSPVPSPDRAAPGRRTRSWWRRTCRTP